MTAKNSSMRTVVSGWDNGVCIVAVRDLSGDLAGEEANDGAEGRRGSEGTESVDSLEDCEGLWACAGSD